MPQPLWNKESLENLSQIVPKGYRISESYATETRVLTKTARVLQKMWVAIQPLLPTGRHFNQ